MQATAVLLLLLSLPVWIGCGYLLLLTLLSAANPVPPRVAARQRFAVVVPAHDEAAGIGRTVRSLLALDWPSALRQIVVVADNCSDDTASLARAAGARVIERFDEQLRGKGYALKRAFDTLLEEGVTDAIVVVDADTDVSADLLQGFAARLEQGAPAIQAFYGVRNPRASWRTRLMTIALGIFHRLRGRGRERLRVSSGLRGNGMCFSVDTLRRMPYAAYSKVEDMEYGVYLGQQGIRVWYADEIEVRGDMVASEAASRSQRERWEGGRMQFAREHGPALLWQALRGRDRVLLDLALDTLVPPLLNLALLALLLALAGLLAAGFGGIGAGALAITLPPLAMLLLYVARGVSLSGLGAGGWAVLAAAPLYAVWKLSLKFRRGARREGWVRTEREPQEPGT